MSDTNKAKIITFGKITELQTGQLEFSDFHIDNNNEFAGDEVCLLTVIIRRLQAELLEAEARQKQSLGRYRSELLQ